MPPSVSPLRLHFRLPYFAAFGDFDADYAEPRWPPAFGFQAEISRRFRQPPAAAA